MLLLIFFGPQASSSRKFIPHVTSTPCNAFSALNKRWASNGTMRQRQFQGPDVVEQFSIWKMVFKPCFLATHNLMVFNHILVWSDCRVKKKPTAVFSFGRIIKTFQKSRWWWFTTQGWKKPIAHFGREPSPPFEVEFWVAKIQALEPLRKLHPNGSISYPTKSAAFIVVRLEMALGPRNVQLQLFGVCLNKSRS